MPTSRSERRIVLSGGTLDVAVRSETWPLDALCDFAARDSARRGFLIVSRVLGRHLPTTPAVMRASFETLAAQLGDDLPGPIVVIGMAETAVCLGLGVHAAYRRRTGRVDTLGLHTTRQQIDAEIIASFEEPHSHASAHLIYRPAEPSHRALLAAARTLVVVDDEASTGTTVRNLVQAFAPSLPCLTEIRIAVLTDWCDNDYWLGDMPASTVMTSLLSGTLTWRATAERPPTFNAVAAGALGRLDAHVNFGRLGIQEDPDITRQLAGLALGPAQPVLVLGTGEFTWPTFLLAQALADAGHPTTMQATTRSPVHLGGAMGRVLCFADNYATGVGNFLYNVVPVAGRRVLICQETPRGSVDPPLVEALEAQCVAFGA